MTSTERKLDEAKYFLSKMNIHDPYFDYNLSAFLNSARSTTWIMKHEFNKISEWQEWYNALDVTAEQNTLFNKINELRILSTKQSGIKTEYLMFDCLALDEQYYARAAEMLKEFEGEEIVITVEEIREKSDEKDPNDEDLDDETYVFRGTVKVNNDKKEDSRESIFKLSQSYFAFLEIIVKDCVSKFSIVP